MAHASQVVYVKVRKGKNVGEGEAEVFEQEFVGDPRVPVTRDEAAAALNDAVGKAIQFLARFLDYGVSGEERGRYLEG